MAYDDRDYILGSSSRREYTAPALTAASTGNPVTSQGMVIQEGDSVNLLPNSRAGTEIRQRYINHLTDMHSQGYLPDDEYEKRLELAQRADTVKFLGHLIHDLPAMPDPESEAARKAREDKAAADKEREEASFSYRWKNDHGFHNVLCAIGIALGAALAATPITVLSVMPVPQSIALAVGLPCLAAGVILLIFSIVELAVRIDGM